MEEADVARGLLAEALWRQQRPRAAGVALEAIRGSSLERRRPLVLLIEAEASAASGEPDRAAALMERVLGSVGVDEAWRLRGGVEPASAGHCRHRCVPGRPAPPRA